MSNKDSLLPEAPVEQGKAICLSSPQGWPAPRTAHSKGKAHVLSTQTRGSVRHKAPRLQVG